MNKSRQELFESASIPKAFFALTIPAALGKVIMLFYNIADTWFIANTDNANLVAGVSLCGPIFMLMIAMGDIFGVGGSSVISRLFGKGDRRKLADIIRFFFAFQLCMSTVVALALEIFSRPLVEAFMDDPAILTAGTAILRRQLLGMPFAAVMLVCACIFQASGKSGPALALSLSRQGVVYLIVIVIANALLGYSGVIAAQPMADLLSAVLAIALLVKSLGRESVIGSY